MKISLGFFLILFSAICARKCNQFACVESLSTTGCKFKSIATCRGRPKNETKPGTCTQLSNYKSRCTTYGKEDGVKCSELLAREDMHRFDSKLKKAIKSCGHIDNYILAGIISRESRAGGALNSRGWGDCLFGRCKAYGAMQVDNLSATQNRTSRVDIDTSKPWNSVHAVWIGAHILKSQIEAIQRKHRYWSLEDQTKGGIAAYNFGSKNVDTISGMDLCTAGNDYANDVVARAKFFKRHRILD